MEAHPVTQVPCCACCLSPCSPCSDELDRPENAMLKPVVEKLKQAKAVIDEYGAKTGAGPISWADLLVLAGKVTTVKEWAEIKVRAPARADAS